MGENGHQDYDFVFYNSNVSDSFDNIRFSYNYSRANRFDYTDFINTTKDVETARNEADVFLDTTIKEFSTYLQVVVGFITDRYFWNIYGLKPVLPSLIADKSVSTDGLNWIVGGVKKLYLETIKDSSNTGKVRNIIIKPQQLVDFYTATIPLLSRPEELRTVSEIVDNYYSRQPIDVEFIEMELFSIPNIRDIMNKHSNEYDEKVLYQFVEWNDNIIVGGFCSKDGHLAMSNSHKRVVQILYNPDHYNPLPLSQTKAYKLINNTIMESKNDFTKMVSPSFRERLGDLLIKHGQRLKDSNNVESPVSKVWGAKDSEPNTQNLEIKDLENFFISLINGDVVEVEPVTDEMTIARFLEWLDTLDQGDINANKLFILRSYVKEYNRYLYAAFLGNNRTVFLQHNELIKCYVCDHESAEMKELFADNPIYVIPFEK